MIINLYNNASDPRVLDKEITLGTELTGELKDKCDIENPTILIEGISAINYNYAYIPEFGRFYFFKEPPTVIANNLVEIKLHVDVLKTYASQIRGCKGIIRRQEKKFNKYLNDDEYQAYAYEIISAYAFNTPFTKASVPYLTLLGGDLT